jgi:rhodanese-related sulfurtransferase
MPMANLTAEEARARQTQGATLIDVRSTREYAAGHPAGAVNVPLMEHDEDTGELAPNPDFVRVVKAHFPTETSLLVSCQSGVRSVRASQMLEAFGYQDVTNVLGGFGGARDGSAAGWQPSGLPVETTAPAGSAYQDLLRKADEL